MVRIDEEADADADAHVDEDEDDVLLIGANTATGSRRSGRRSHVSSIGLAS